MISKTVSSGVQGVFSDIFDRYALHLLIFLTALFIIITISNPATFFNDEWITLNQLRQMDQGHQTVYNEGTYGVFKNGTITPYFDAKARYLGYTLMLPVLSWPILKFFSLFGDNFRFFVIFLWAFLPVIITVILSQWRPIYDRVRGFSWTWIMFVLMTGLFFLNIIFYYPFPFYGDTVPREIAAIVFTQHILFALLCVVVFSIINLYIKDTWYSLFGLIICMGCSSYIFWATNAKDHILTVTILAIALFFLLRYLGDGKLLDGISGFISIGLLSWARPEFALMMFVFSAAFFIFLNIFIYKKKTASPFSFRYHNLFLPVATVFGALPFFLNNYYVNKNPFIPTFLFYITKSDGNVISSNISPSQSVGGIIQQCDFIGIENPLINKIISYLSLKTTDFFGNFFSIMVNPQNEAMSILSIVPIFFIIFVMLIHRLWYRKTQTFRISWAIIYLCILLLGLPLAYIGGIEGLNTSPGITPDIRYLSPIYLIIALLGVFLVYSFLSEINWKKIFSMTLTIIGLGVAFNLFILLMVFTGGGTAPEYINFYNVFSLVLGCIAAMLFILTLRNEKLREYCALFIGAMVISPLSWQILMTYFFASAKFNGYPFWIPIMEFFYHSLLSS